jgi:hypothetical protein
MRKLLFLICVLGIPCAAWAQSKPTSWENLNTLQAGEKIQAVEMNSTKVSGTFLSISDVAISLQEKAGQLSIRRQDVRSVKLMKHQHRLRNTLVLGGVGAGVGAAIGAATLPSSCKGQPFCFDVGRSIPPALGAVIGLLGGAVFGALLPSHKPIYRVKPQ